MATAGNLADWWDQQHREYKKLLEDWVEDNPQWWAVGLATLATIPTELGAGLVDVLRLGQGVAQGGVGGFGTDALRLLAIAGPVGRGVRTVFKGGQGALARLVVDPGGPICTYMAATKALRHTGAKLFATVDDLASAVGHRLPPATLPAVWAETLVPVLARLGARVKTLAPPQTWADVANAARANDGVVLFAVRWTLTAGPRAGQSAAHTLYAFKDALGQVRFADRVGRVVRTLDELDRFYPGIGGATVHAAGGKGAMVVLENARVVSLQSGLAALVLPVAKLMAVNADEVPPAVVARAFEAKKAASRGSPIKTLTPLPGDRHLPPVQYLTGVQARLNDLGYGAGPVDGINGPKTKRAVSAFQRDYGLRVDAIPGPRTQAELLEVHGS